MPGQLFRRYLALAIVGLWLAPSASALALGLHMALDHHGSHHGGDAPRHKPPLLAELLVAAVHGHHHSAAAPHHEHPALLDATPGLSPIPIPFATVPEDPRVATDDGHGKLLAFQHRRAPPVSLFHVHCSLLL